MFTENSHLTQKGDKLAFTKGSLCSVSGDHISHSYAICYLVTHVRFHIMENQVHFGLVYNKAFVENRTKYVSLTQVCWHSRQQFIHGVAQWLLKPSVFSRLDSSCLFKYQSVELCSNTREGFARHLLRAENYMHKSIYILLIPHGSAHWKIKSLGKANC